MKKTGISKEERLGSQILKKIDFYRKSEEELRGLEEQLDFFNTQYKEADRFAKVTEFYTKVQKLKKEMNYQLDRIRISFEKFVIDTNQAVYVKEVYKEIDIVPKLESLAEIVNKTLKNP